MSQSSGGHTSVRLPCCTLTMPSIARACTVSRATVRLTPKRLTISSDDGNASPTPMRPETISAARSVESCWLSRCGSRNASTRARGPSPDMHTACRELEAGEVPFEQQARGVRQLRRGRSQAIALKDAALHEHPLRTGVVVVDRVLHLEHEHRQERREALVGEHRLAAPLGLVDLHEQIDQVDAG